MSKLVTPFGFESTTSDVLQGVDLSGRTALATGANAGIGLIASLDEQAGPHTRLVRVAIPADLAGAVEELARAQRQRKAALDAEYLEAAAALRDREDQLRADKLRTEAFVYPSRVPCLRRGGR